MRRDALGDRTLIEFSVGQKADQDQGDNLDLEALAELQDLLEEDFVALLQEFIDSSKQTSVELAQQIMLQDQSEVRRGAHSLKGSALNIGAPILGATLATLEDAAVQASTKAELEALLHQMQNELELTVTALQARFV